MHSGFNLPVRKNGNEFVKIETCREKSRKERSWKITIRRNIVIRNQRTKSNSKIQNDTSPPPYPTHIHASLILPHLTTATPTTPHTIPSSRFSLSNFATVCWCQSRFGQLFWPHWLEPLTPSPHFKQNPRDTRNRLWPWECKQFAGHDHNTPSNNESQIAVYRKPCLWFGSGFTTTSWDQTLEIRWNAGFTKLGVVATGKCWFLSQIGTRRCEYVQIAQGKQDAEPEVMLVKAISNKTNFAFDIEQIIFGVLAGGADVKGQTWWGKRLQNRCGSHEGQNFVLSNCSILREQKEQNGIGIRILMQPSTSCPGPNCQGCEKMKLIASFKTFQNISKLMRIGFSRTPDFLCLQVARACGGPPATHPKDGPADVVGAGVALGKRNKNMQNWLSRDCHGLEFEM